VGWIRTTFCGALPPPDSRGRLSPRLLGNVGLTQQAFPHQCDYKHHNPDHYAHSPRSIGFFSHNFRYPGEICPTWPAVTESRS
jgi:hypothetical protein